MGVKSVLGRVIFRKIGGRIVPIRIHNVADKVATANSTIDRFRKIQAKLPNGDIVGSLHLAISKKPTVKAEVMSVEVAKHFRKKGISKNLFERAKQFLTRANFKFLRSYDIQHVAQIKVRKGGGFYKAGPKNKLRTKFLADGFGRFQEEKMRVSRSHAIDILKQNQSPLSKGQQVQATTMLRKFWRKK